MAMMLQKKVKARAQRSILWSVNVMKPIRDKIGQRISAVCQVPVTGKPCGVIITTPGGSTTPIWNHLMTAHKGNIVPSRETWYVTTDFQCMCMVHCIKLLAIHVYVGILDF